MKYPVAESRSQLRAPKIGHYDPAEETHHLFALMKSSQTPESLWSRAVPIQLEEFSEFRLLPLSQIHTSSSKTISNLVEWRNANINLFSPRIPATFEGTTIWLQNLINNNPDRILFLVVDKHGNEFGHLGIWRKENGIFEVDNVLRNPQIRNKGLFRAAVITLGKWVNEFIGIQNLSLRVLQSNHKAKSFYEHLGFEEIARSYIRIEKSEHGDIFVESDQASSDDAWITMEVIIENFNSAEDYVLTAGPSIGPFEISFVSEAVRNGWNHHHSDFLTEFTSQFADYVQAKFAIPTDSCTSALHLAMWSLGIGPGDEVIVPEVTWVATANAVRYVGATPVFADVDPVTWCIDPESVRKLITKKTKAIAPVHLYGYVADLQPLVQICEEYGLKLVQDAAPGIGSTYNGAGVATLGDFTCFSFQGAKLLVSGEGGVLTTNDPELYAKAFKIGDSGRKPGTFWIEILGKKMKMSNVTAALALSQLQSAERQINKKRQIRDWYKEELSEIDGISFQEELPNTRSICWMTSIHINRAGFNRENFRQRLLDDGVETRPVFSPISRYPIWINKPQEGKIAARIGDNAINLPSGVNLSRATIAKVAKSIKSNLSK